MDRPSRFVLRLALMILMGWAVYRVLAEFFEPLAWCGILVFASWPLFQRLRGLLGGQGGWSALLMVSAIAVAILAPLSGLSYILQWELAEFFRNLPGWLEGKPELPPWVAAIPFLGDELQVVYEQFEDLQTLARRYLVPRLTPLSRQLLSMAEGAGFVVAKWVITVVLMFFGYRDGALVLAEVRKALRMGIGPDAETYLQTVERTTRAVFYGLVLTAMAQGAVAGIGYWGVGLPSPTLLTLATMVAALIPFGAVVVWALASLWLVFHGQLWQGLALVLWGTVAVGWVDNLVRPLVISRTTRIPFVVVLLGALGGISGFGFIGLFMGPVVLAVALAIWNQWLAGAGSATGGAVPAERPSEMPDE